MHFDQQSACEATTMGKGKKLREVGWRMAIKRTLPPSNSALILASSWRTHLTKIREEKDFKQSVVKNPIEVIVFMEIQ